MADNVTHCMLVHFNSSLGENYQAGEKLRRDIEADCVLVGFVDF